MVRDESDRPVTCVTHTGCQFSDHGKCVAKIPAACLCQKLANVPIEEDDETGTNKEG